MEELKQRLKRAAENILGNESLTASLSDAAAQRLVQWGVQYAEQAAYLCAGLDDAQAEQAVALRLASVRQLMRTVNHWVANWDSLEPERPAAILDQIVSHAQTIRGEDYTPPSTEQRTLFLSRLGISGDTPQFIDDLRSLLEGGAPVQASAEPGANPPTPNFSQQESQ